MKNYYELNNLISAKFVEYENGALEVKTGTTTEKYLNPNVGAACHVIGLFETVKRGKGLWEAVTDGLEENEVLEVLHGYAKACMQEGEPQYIPASESEQITLENGVRIVVTDSWVMAFVTIVSVHLRENAEDAAETALKTYYTNLLKN